jgi:hypothetical protein
VTDLLAAGVDWLVDQLKRFAARPVLYCRGQQQVSVSALSGKQLLKLADGRGNVRMEWTDKDFLIQAADLVLEGKEVLPQRGDQIRDQVGDKVFIYEVMAPTGEPPWRWSDPYRKLLRIHAKHVGTQEAS